MITIYYLPVDTTNDTEFVLGIELIHHAILECTEDPDIRKLIMDTTAEEHSALFLLSTKSRNPTQEEIDLYNSTVIIEPPDPDTIRAQEILATSPNAITMPETWELLRIIGRRLGYSFKDTI